MVIFLPTAETSSTHTIEKNWPQVLPWNFVSQNLCTQLLFFIPMVYYDCSWNREFTYYVDYTYNVHGTKYAETLAYLQVVLSEEELTALMVAENAFSLRPLEFAALHGCMGMVDIIIQTRGVYLINEELVGYNVIQYLDVSDYELFDDGLPPRLFNSPLHFLIFTETSRLEMMGSDAVFDDPVLKSWISAKIVMNNPFVLVWLVLRFLFIGLIFSASLDSNWPTVFTNASTDGNSTERWLFVHPQIQITVVFSGTYSRLYPHLLWFTTATAS